MHEKNQASSENDLSHFHKVRHGSFGWMKNQKGRIAKGQLISKCLFGIFNSSKKRTKKFDFTTMATQVELFSFVFWEN